MPSPTSNRFRNLASLLLSVTFLGILWIPLADSVIHFDPSPAPNEKRAPAPFPKFEFSLPALRDYFSGLENYYNDHFGFRKTLLRWEHKWKRSWFRESSVTEAMLGRNGWLYLARGGMVDDMLGKVSLDEVQLREWEKLFQFRRDWCAERGIAYQLVIAPEKHSVYPEYLPEWIPTIRKHDSIDQLVAHLRSQSTIPILDLRAPLREAAKTNLTFQVTDTHWNDFGAFIGYQNLIQALAAQCPELRPLPLDAFEVQHSEEPGGDLAVMLGQEQSLHETNHITLVPKAPLANIATESDPNLFLSNPHAAPPLLVATNPAASGTAILFRDSFATAWQPFLGHHFHRVIYVWQHDWDLAFLEQQKPDVIIDEVAARSFYRGDPKSWRNE